MLTHLIQAANRLLRSPQTSLPNLLLTHFFTVILPMTAKLESTHLICQQSVKKTDDYEYIETQYGAVLTRYTGNSTRVRIPSEIGGIAVKALFGTPVQPFDFVRTFGIKSLAAVQIPEGITYIGKGAFSDNQLTSVTIPNSVTFIGYNAFSRNKLTSVTIPNSVTNLCGFDDNQLTSITIPNSVTFIGFNAFENNQLTSVIIPNSVTSIYAGAFANNPLTSVTFQGTIANLNSYVFNGDLRDKYLARGIGRYTRPNASSNTWTKQ
jgi:hypothetical protein